MLCKTFRATCHVRRNTMSCLIKLPGGPMLDKTISYGGILRLFGGLRNKAVFCTDSNDSSQSSKVNVTSVKPPTDLCCMAGCVNCVWFEYADLLILEYTKKGLTLDIQDLLKEIDEDVDDPIIRAYIKLEIKSKFK